MNQKATPFIQVLFLALILIFPLTLMAQPIASNNVGSGSEDQIITVVAIQSNDMANGGTLVLSTIDLNMATLGNQSSFTSNNGQWSVDYFTGDVIFVPNAHFNGAESIFYTIQNSNSQVSNSAQITVNLTPVNDAPFTQSNYLSFTEDAGVQSGNMLTNGDYDVENTAMSCNAAPIVNASNGTFTLALNGDYTYTPNADFYGLDMVVVAVCDAGSPLPSACSNDTLFINVSPVNDAPLAVNDAFTVNENSISTLNELANDSDIDNPLDLTSVEILFGPVHGNAVILNGEIVYTPTIGYSGMDSIFYQICDSAAPLTNICSQAWIHITVNPCVLNPAADCDGDGVINSTEITDNTDPSDPCDFLATSQTETYGSVWVNSDCDADGYTNGLELGMGYDFADDCSFPFVAQNAVASGAWTSADCDGDGVTNGDEVLSNTNGSDWCSFYPISISLAPAAGWSTLDCDGDGVTNADEISDNTNPTNPCSLDPLSITIAQNNLWGFLDCDGDGVQNADELADSTYYLDLCNYLASSITMPQTSDWLNEDCDGDGVINGDETTDNTDPQNGCEFIIASQTVPTSTAWNGWDCDEDGVTNSTELTDNTVLTDPCSFIAASITLPVGSTFNLADCDADGLNNGYENTIATDPFNPDTDGDGINEGNEVNQGSDPLDPCDPLPSLASCIKDLIIPEGISPNGDNINDNFFIGGADYYANNKLTIYNRYGSEVYSFGPGYTNQFVGKASVSSFGTELLPEGTYFFIFDLFGDGTEAKEGYLYIKR